MILILDNRDSFVWNLARYFDLLGVETIVCPSHATDVPHLRGLAPEALVISPAHARQTKQAAPWMQCGHFVEACRCWASALGIR
jgi:anthranilate/para-aminobenzoate synthase component II